MFYVGVHSNSQAACSAIRVYILTAQFLLAVQDRDMKEAQGMLKELLEFEPNNKMLAEYKKYIAEYIAQGNLLSFL